MSGLIPARFSDEKGITHSNSKCKELFIHFDVCLKKLCAFPFLPNCMSTLISPQCDEATTKQSRRHCPLSSLYYSPECASILFLYLVFFFFVVVFLFEYDDESDPQNSLSFSKNGEKEKDSLALFLLSYFCW